MDTACGEMVLVSIRAGALWARAGHCIIYIVYSQDKSVLYPYFYYLVWLWSDGKICHKTALLASVYLWVRKLTNECWKNVYATHSNSGSGHKGLACWISPRVTSLKPGRAAVKVGKYWRRWVLWTRTGSSKNVCVLVCVYVFKEQSVASWSVTGWLW